MNNKKWMPDEWMKHCYVELWYFEKNGTCRCNPKLPDDAGEHLQPDDAEVWNP